MKDYQIQEIDLAPKHFIIHRGEVPFQGISDFFQKQMAQLGSAVAQAGISFQGMPCGLYFDWNEETGKTDMAVAIPTPPGSSLTGYDRYEIVATKAITLDYYGSYDNLRFPHEALNNYLQQLKVNKPGIAMEEYITDPGTEPDPNKWLTKITYTYS